MPLNHGYPKDFDAKDPKTAMRAVPRVKSYRGFVFASDGGRRAERSKNRSATCRPRSTTWWTARPDGEIEVAGGVFKHAYDANWKIYFENLCDAAHPIFTHRSSIEASQAQSDDVHSDGTGEIAIRQMRQNGAPYSFLGSRRSASGPIRTATAISATITTTQSSSRR